MKSGGGSPVHQADQKELQGACLFSKICTVTSLPFLPLWLSLVSCTPYQVPEVHGEQSMCPALQPEVLWERTSSFSP